MEGWPVIGGRKRAASTKPAEIALVGCLPLKPYLLEIREQSLKKLCGARAFGVRPAAWNAMIALEV